MEREDAAGHGGQEEGEAETEGMCEQTQAQGPGSVPYAVPFFHTVADCAGSLVAAAIDGGACDEL